MKIHSKIVADLILHYADNGIGAEIGVYKGQTSRQILETTSTKMLYMIDQYRLNYDKSQTLYSKRGNPDADYEFVRKYFSEKFPNRHTLIRKTSEQSGKELDVALDFIFIDANHTYEHVMKDLQIWVPKVRSGGLIIGHDWWSKFPGVITAVIEFVRKTSAFKMPQKPRSTIAKTKYIPAPSVNPIVFKSWPGGHIWWALKADDI